MVLVCYFRPYLGTKTVPSRLLLRIAMMDLDEKLNAMLAQITIKLLQSVFPDEFFLTSSSLRTCLHEGGGPQVGEVTYGG